MSHRFTSAKSVSIYRDRRSVVLWLIFLSSSTDWGMSDYDARTNRASLARSIDSMHLPSRIRKTMSNIVGAHISVPARCRRYVFQEKVSYQAQTLPSSG
ncbi:hypothetical protein F5146DRAFT_1037257 [Armillaria mellea]|nr:hypothetical protein F5146DRAFT_1037257 [Armillaria mellea]